MNTKRIIFIALLSVIATVSLAGYILFGRERLKAPVWSLSSGELEVEGITREFSYYAPEGLSASPALVFLLHGSKGSGTRLRYLTNYEFEKVAHERKNVILVYPQGYDNHWNDCRGSAGYRAKTENIDDIAFFRSMISYFQSNYSIDAQAVFAAGYSNGGQMGMKLAYEIPELISGVGVFAANQPVAENNDCEMKGLPVSMMFINGTGDRLNPYSGGWVVAEGDSSRGKVYSTEETLRYWLDLLPCSAVQEKIFHQNAVEDDDSFVEHTRISCPGSSYRVELVAVQGGGHTIPLRETPPYLPRRLGASNRDISSPELVLNFFESLRR